MLYLLYVKKTAKNKMTTEDLALSMDKGFKRVENLIEKRVDELAISTANGFESVNKRFNVVEKDISELKKDTSELKKDTSELKESVKGIRGDISNLGDRFPSQFAFDQLSSRVYTLEKKSKEKTR